MTTRISRTIGALRALLIETLALADTRRVAAELELKKVRGALQLSQAEANVAWDALTQAERLKREVSDPSTQRIADSAQQYLTERNRAQSEVERLGHLVKQLAKEKSAAIEEAAFMRGRRDELAAALTDARRDLRQARTDTERLRSRLATACPDGGTCHHGCTHACWRVTHCGPLSGAFPDDEWPEDVVEAHTPVEPEDTATEPLFTGALLGVWAEPPNPYSPHARIAISDDATAAYECDAGTKVDVYPHGVRPAAPTVTAAMVTEATKASGPYSLGPGYAQECADALNRLLAEQGGEG